MIEYNFTELDNDFITCWCKYLLTGDKKLIMKDLEKLAELGQINAIQEWYRFNKVGDNAVIDKMLETLGDTYNDLLIKARVNSKVLSQIETQNKWLAYVDEEEWKSGARFGYYELTERAKQARKAIRDISYIDAYYCAANIAFQIGNRTNDVLVLETANEIYSELAKNLGIDSYCKQIDKNVKKINSKICRCILKDLKMEKKQNSSYDPLTNPRVCFALSKAVLLFNDDHKKKDLAIQLLKELANREYSQTFKTAKTTKR